LDALRRPWGVILRVVDIGMKEMEIGISRGKLRLKEIDFERTDIEPVVGAGE
jgi:hypothetical protein